MIWLRMCFFMLNQSRGKILSVVVPCYNSAEYMGKCIESLLIGGDRVEIIVVNDGSSDGTHDIACKYQEKYPNIIKYIKQENKGHGGAVNAGIKNAIGYYFKVVDSDDSVDGEVLLKVLDTLEDMISSDKQVDVFVCNFLYDKQNVNNKKVMDYSGMFPENKIFTWDEVKTIVKWKYIMMHAVLFRRNLLLDCELELPEHKFYVDNIFVFKPLMYAKKLYYLNGVLYKYYIGRSDQSVNENVMISRIDQQIFVNKVLVDLYIEFKKMPAYKEKKLRRLLFNYLELIAVTSSTIPMLSQDKHVWHKREKLWRYIQDKDISLYHQLRFGIVCFWMNFPGKTGQGLTKIFYRLMKKIFCFN